MAKYLDENGLLYFWTKLKGLLAGKVDVETGKGLSTNDFTNADQTKLNGIATGAEVNQNAFSNVKVGTTTIAADSKTDTLTLAAGDNVTLEADATGDKVTINAAAPAYTGTAPIEVTGSTISHNTSGVTAGSKGDTTNQTPSWGGTFKVPSGTVNATGHMTAFADHNVTIPNTEASTSAAGLMSKSDKSKLDGVATGAQVNVIETVKVNGTALAVTGKEVDVSVPTKTSELTNDSGFITQEDVPEGAAASTTTPKMDGTAAVGKETAFARGDHVHPTDTSRAPLASPTFTGTPKSTTATKGTNTTQIATTEFVQTAIGDKQDKLTFDASPKSGSTNPVTSGGVYTALGAKLDTTTAESTYAKKTDLSNVYKFKGSVASYADLPSTGNTAGDVYDVQSDGMNYAWTGTAWDQLGMTLEIQSISNADIDTIMAA